MGNLNTPTPPLTTSTTPSSTRGPATPAPGQSTSRLGKGEGCTREHVMYCMDVLSAHFERREPVAAPFEGADEKMALFVTWNTSASTRSGSDKRPALRGCIGNFTPMPLGRGLKEYALISALEDHRFSPIRQSELTSLSCSVSLLTPTVPIPDPLAWTPGIHGIHISFPHPTSPGRRLSATYLPEIATDQNWSREETIQSAIAKAGFRGKVRVGDEVWKSLKVGVYESTKCSVGWGEYLEWVKGLGDEQEQEEEEED